LGQTGVIGDSNDYYLQVTVSQIFEKKKGCLCPKMNPQNTQTVLELSVMNIYNMDYEKMGYNVKY
jgi:hypothetical protein